MNDSLKNLFAVSDLRNRVLFTLGMLGVYRVGNHITIPGIDNNAVLQFADQLKNTMFGLYDMATSWSTARRSTSRRTR